MDITTLSEHNFTISNTFFKDIYVYFNTFSEDILMQICTFSEDRLTDPRTFSEDKSIDFAFCGYYPIIFLRTKTFKHRAGGRSVLLSWMALPSLCAGHWSARVIFSSAKSDGATAHSAPQRKGILFIQ